MNDEFLAKSELSFDSTTPGQLLAGESDVVTNVGTLITGQNLAELRVVGRITASGKLTAWVPGASDGSQKAIGILAFSTDATSADKACQFYTGGVFNIAALGWGSATAVQKAAAFDGTNIQVRAVG